MFTVYRVWKENNGLKLVNLGERSDEERNCGWKNFLIFGDVSIGCDLFLRNDSLKTLVIDIDQSLIQTRIGSFKNSSDKLITLAKTI